MNNKDFIATMASRTDMRNSEVQRLVDTFVGVMGDHFMDGDAVLLPNLGTFEVKKKLERIIVNPSTGQRMLVPPKLVLGFKPSVEWKGKIKKGGNS